MKSLARTLTNAVTKTAAPPVPYSSAGGYNNYSMLLNGANDNETYQRAYGTSGTVFQIVSLLASSTAAADWRLYRKAKQDGRVRYTTSDQGSDQRTEVLQHLALNVWDHPNPFQTRPEFVEAAMQHLELCGEMWWVVARDARASFPTGMWIVRPDRIEVVPSPTQFISGYVYCGPSGEKVPLGVDEVVCTKLPNPLDAHRGLGPVQSILADIDATKYSAEWNRNYFLNSAQPSGVVTVPNSLTDEEFTIMNNRWRESHQGVSRAHRVAFLEAGATFALTQQSMRDMDFSNLRNSGRDLLREAWGIHKSMLGNSDDVNRANAQTAEEVFGRWKVIPRLNRIRETLNERFLPMFGPTGENVEFDYVNPLPDDRESDNSELTAKATAAQLLVGAGFDADDVCEVVGLPPMGFEKPAPPVMASQVGSGDEQGGDTTGEPAEQADDAPQNRAQITLWRPRNATAPDLTAVDAQWQAAVDQLVGDYNEQITPAQQQQVLADIEHDVDTAEIAALGALVVDSTAAKALLLAAMVAYASTAAHQAVSEAEQQGQGTLTPQTPPHTALAAIAGVTAALMAAELAVSAGREAMRVWHTGATGADVADDVRPYLEGLSDTGIRQHLSAAMSDAQNKARLATFKAGPHADLYATEVLDKNTCGPCELINGTRIGNTSEPDIEARAEALYPAGGYVGCLGKERCRGTIHAVYTPVNALLPARHVNGHPKAGV